VGRQGASLTQSSQGCRSVSYVQWATTWHIVLPRKTYTLCGRWVEPDAHRREIPPLEVFLCKVCGGAA